MTATHCSFVRFFQILRVSGFKPPVRRSSHWPKIPAVVLCLASAAMAEVSGNFTYIVEGTIEVPTITITAYSTSAAGPVVIPETIAGKDVTKIGSKAFFNRDGVTTISVPSKVMTILSEAFAYCDGLVSISMPSGVTSLGVGAFAQCTALTSLEIPAGVAVIPQSMLFGCSALAQITIPPTVDTIGITAFQNCNSLTSVTISPGVEGIGNKAFNTCVKLTSVSIPASVTSIGTEVFINCSSLTSISVADANAYFSSLNGVLFNESQDTLIAFPPGFSGGYSVPAGVTTIGPKAFFTCKKLVGVTLPNGLTSVKTQAFSTCSALLYANFMGDAPTEIDFNEFSLTPDGFTVFYLNDFSEDFTIYPWTDFKNLPVNMGTNDTPSTAWLLSKGLPANTDIQSDSNGDGVKLLMARALNLDPHRNLSGEMPRPVIAGNQMSMSFYAAAAGITYRVKTSENLTDWTTEVPRSEPDANQISTATVNISGPARYMRLEVSH